MLQDDGRASEKGAARRATLQPRWVTEWRAARAHKRRIQTLDPLTAEFISAQHQDYVDYLNTALRNSKVRNIALTGRYGSGKSSVLEQFARENRRRVLLLSLSSLGPEEVIGEDGGTSEPPSGPASEGPERPRVNQIQKELVKQLLHVDPPARLPQSRYQRIERLTRWRAFAEAAATLVAVVAILWLFDALPDIPRLNGGDPARLWVTATAIAALAAISAVASIRMAVHNRLEVSQVSAAGASVSLTKKDNSYFDQYLDEIVYFFQCRPTIDVVVFEDLDRFNQAGIFEALRELNTLLNSSRQITVRQPWLRRKRTLRFVYALRDSIFEQLGHDTKELGDDAAQAESVRANRTKFFDLVIPLVPFITHRTSRELLSNALTDDDAAPVPAVSDELVDIVARHVPDMRLLKNIRNEFAVFAKRLITDHNGMDTLSADQLFAMIAYKNVHLEDFELILLGRSKLDTLYRKSRDVVNGNIASRRDRSRAIADDIAANQALVGRARTWGERLDWFAQKIAASNPRKPSLAYAVDGSEYPVNKVGAIELWQAVLNANIGITIVVQDRNYNTRQNVILDMSELRKIVGDNLQPSAGLNTANEALEQEQTEILVDLETLRTADFEQLAKRPDFTVPAEEDEKEVNDAEEKVDDEEADTGKTFTAFIEETIESELGQVLVSNGYINRYYNMYIAQYYGDRLPPNAMSYIVQNVDSNRSDFNYAFANPEEIAALLKETKRAFLNEKSAYNVGILDYLLEQGDKGAHTILEAATNQLGPNERAFLDAYLSSGNQARKAVSFLATRWSGIFTQIVERAIVSKEQRTILVDAALANSRTDVPYEIDDTVRDYMQANYQHFSTIAELAKTTDADEGGSVDGTFEQSQAEAAPATKAIENAVETLSRTGFICNDLSALRDTARRPIVEADCYALTAANLRTILGEEASLSLDAVRTSDRELYRDLLEHPEEYIQVLSSNAAAASDTPGADAPGLVEAWTIRSPTQFGAVLADFIELDEARAAELIEKSNPACIVDNLLDAPGSTWHALAKFRRLRLNLLNVDTYMLHIGLDAHLGAALNEARSIDLSGPTAGWADDAASPTEIVSAVKAAKERIAVQILDGRKFVRDPFVRARLVESLDMREWLPVEKVTPEGGRLLGYLVGMSICSDTAETFSHFALTEWEPLRFAIGQSAKFGEFVTPTLLPPKLAAGLLQSDQVSDALKVKILGRFDEFVPEDDSATLTAAGEASVATNTFIGVPGIARIAGTTKDTALVMRMTSYFGDLLTPDEIILVLGEAGGQYGRLSTPGSKATFPRTIDHDTVFRRLKAEGRITFRSYDKTLTKNARIDVKVL
ncbi:hypothetical protein [Nocardioides sp. NPDC004968]|uniref:YobI family P-loop NTPase n=1 Tax=Nocardioides sp. NPDC004968 TaxID=3155894 RepID=UPI0033A39BEA